MVTDKSNGKPLFSSGLFFKMCNDSRMRRSKRELFLSIILKWFLFNAWPLSKWWSLMDDWRGLETGKLLRGETPQCSEILHWNCLIEEPIYCFLQSRQSYEYTIPEQRRSGSFSLCLKRLPIENLFVKTSLRSTCG